MRDVLLLFQRSHVYETERTAVNAVPEVRFEAAAVLGDDFSVAQSRAIFELHHFLDVQFDIAYLVLDIYILIRDAEDFVCEFVEMDDARLFLACLGIDKFYRMGDCSVFEQFGFVLLGERVAVVGLVKLRLDLFDMGRECDASVRIMLE